jgi:hypothetical protein
MHPDVVGCVNLFNLAVLWITNFHGILQSGDASSKQTNKQSTQFFQRRTKDHRTVNFRTRFPHDEALLSMRLGVRTTWCTVELPKRCFTFLVSHFQVNKSRAHCSNDPRMFSWICPGVFTVLCSHLSGAIT